MCFAALLRTAHEINPRADAHSLTRLHHLQCFIEQHLPSEGIVNDFDDSVRQGKRRLEESFCMLIRPLKANSMTIQPRKA